MNIRHSSILITLSVISFLGVAQEKSIILKKGEAIDLLLLSTNTEAKEEQSEYFEKAIPIASAWGYQPQYSTRISTPPTQGNYWPGVFHSSKHGRTMTSGKRLQKIS